eukprot:7551876-Pyramimonas_sp.AAC.1
MPCLTSFSNIPYTSFLVNPPGSLGCPRSSFLVLIDGLLLLGIMQGLRAIQGWRGKILNMKWACLKCTGLLWIFLFGLP